MQRAIYRGDDTAEYQVGAPPIAFIKRVGARYKPIWQILRVKPDGHLAAADWDYKSPEEALAALQKEADSE
jgi:hypothetical protein